MAQLVIIVILFFLQIVIALRNLIVVFPFLKNNTQMNKVQQVNFAGRLFIVIPCLRETAVIKETLEYFIKIINTNIDFKIIVVTTEKENYEKKLGLSNINHFINDLQSSLNIDKLYGKYNHLVDKETIKEIVDFIKTKRLDSLDLMRYIKQKISYSLTTPQVIEQIILTNPDMAKNIVHLHYDKYNGIMADQLNFAINWLRKEMEASEQDYFCLYNADSRPSFKTFACIIETIVKNKYPQVIQQYSCAFLNIKEVNLLLKGFAVYQTNFELRQGFINSNYQMKKNRYRYIVGHGLIIRFDVLVSLKGFDNSFWCEDICLSNVLIQKKIPIIPLPIIEIMEIPNKLSSLIKQNAVWYSTSLKINRVSKHNKIKYNDLNKNDMNWIICRHLLNLNWIFSPLCFISIFILILFFHLAFFLIIEIFVYLLYILTTFLPTILLAEKLSNIKVKHKFLLLICVALSFLISNLGPLYFLIVMPKQKYKTLR